MYSLGIIIWKIFTETEPWGGILDSDIKDLRFVVTDDYRIQKAVERDIKGSLSRQLLSYILRVRPQDRKTAEEILEWIQLPEVKEGIIREWTQESDEKKGLSRGNSIFSKSNTPNEKRDLKNRDRKSSSIVITE